MRSVIKKNGFAKLRFHHFVPWLFFLPVVCMSERPRDFDAYWESEIARMDRTVPIDFQVETWPKQVAGRDVSLVSVAVSNQKRIYGFLAVPKEKRSAVYPLIATVPGAGPGAFAPECFMNCGEVIALTMNVHFYRPGLNASEQMEKYNAQNAIYTKEVKGVALRSAYENHRYAGYTDRDTYFYHDSFLGVHRLLREVIKRSDVGRVTYAGRSQGGGIGIMLAAFTPRISRALICQPAFCDQSGVKPGWPFLVKRAPPVDRSAVAVAAGYYDPVNFAPRVMCKIRVLVGLLDTTCPPESVHAMYAKLKSPKQIFDEQGVKHSNPPSFAQNQLWLVADE